MHDIEPISDHERTRADDALARAASELGDTWRVWYLFTPYDPAGRFSWCALPNGAHCATCTAHGPDELVKTVRAYLANLPAHIAAARAELKATPPREQRRAQMTRDLISALERAQARAEPAASATPVPS